jgi:type I restriction enzyme S subunit
MVPFLQAVRDCTGGNCKVQRNEYKTEGEVPVIDQGQDFIAGYTSGENSYRGALPVVLFGDHTRTFKYVDFSFALGADGVKALEPVLGFTARFLHYYFLSVKLPNAGYSRHFKFLKEVSVPKPSIDEQRRIVDILSRAEGIVRLWHEAEKKAAELIPALFLDMFGDPATNPKGWPVRKVSNFVSRFEGGKNIQAGSENGSPYRILKVSAVTSGVYRESESKPSPDGYNPPASHIVRAGDMLFSRANTEELVGATAIVERTDGKTLLPDKLWRFVWNEPVELAYMHALFQSHDVRRELGKLSSGTSASMRNISQGKLFQLPLPIAPYANQKDFADKSAMIHSIQSQQIAATAKAQATFDALLAGTFSTVSK